MTALQLLALVAGTFVSEDLTTIAAGLLVHRGELAFSAAAIACGTGIWVGDLGLWLLGRACRSRAVAWRRVAALLEGDRRERSAAAIHRFHTWLHAHAAAAIVGSRFAPGTRLPLYVAAGACGLPLARFAWWSLAAVALWTPALLWLSVEFGERVSMMFAAWFAAGRVVVVCAAILMLIVWRSALWGAASVRLRSGGPGRGRAHLRPRLAAWLSRLWRWEFWPMWVFYAPVAAWTAWLSFRYGGLRTITAANPGMPDGGVVGESKFEILSRLPQEWTVPAILVDSGPCDRRLDAVRAALETRRWTCPLVLKPDVGQRGSGVRLARGFEDVAEYLSRLAAPVVVQPYHPGPFEAGIFYYRMPGWHRGRILCITDKHFPAVVGDGRSTIEDLIWAHPRYRMQAATFFTRLGARRAEVPAPGEHVPLGMAGNHAQGAMFTDGRHLLTPALEARIDSIARRYGGFYIGRFDVRYADRDRFMAGEELAIVELNGATAECTNVYDPAYSLLAAYRQLFVQWRLVFMIGAANRAAGRPVSSTERLFALLRAHLREPAIFPVAD